jgi:urease alpha subunit
MLDLVVTGGTIVSREGAVRADLGVRDGRVVLMQLITNALRVAPLAGTAAPLTTPLTTGNG